MLLCQLWSLTVFLLNALILAGSNNNDKREEFAEVTDKLLVLSGNTVVASSVTSPETEDELELLTNLQYDAVADDVGIAVKLNTDSLGAILGEALKFGNKFQSATSGKVTQVGLSVKDREINTDSYNNAGAEVDEETEQQQPFHERTSKDDVNNEADPTYENDYGYEYSSQRSFDHEDENGEPEEEVANERSRSIIDKAIAQDLVSSGSGNLRAVSEEPNDEQVQDTGKEVEPAQVDEGNQREEFHEEETAESGLKLHEQDRLGAGLVSERHKSEQVDRDKHSGLVEEPEQDTRPLPSSRDEDGRQQVHQHDETIFEENDFPSSENSTKIFDLEFLDVEIDFGGVDDPDGVVEEIMAARRRQRQRFGRRFFHRRRRGGGPPPQRFPTNSNVDRSDAKSGDAVIYDNSGLQIFPFLRDQSPTVSKRLFQAGFGQTPPLRIPNQPSQTRTRFREPDVERRGRRRPQHNRRRSQPPHRRPRNRYHRRRDEHFDQQQPSYYELQQRALHHAYGKNAYVSPPVDEQDHYDRRPRGYNPSRHPGQRQENRRRYHEEDPGYFDDHPGPHNVYDDEPDYRDSIYHTNRKQTREGYQRSHRPSFKSHGYGYKPKKKKKHKKVPVYVPISFKKKKKKKMKIISIYKGFKVEGGQQVAKAVKSVEQCMKLCGITPNCFAGDYNKWTYKCYLFDETNACDDLEAHPKVIHFQKVPCELDDLDNVAVNLGQQAFGGIIQKGVKSLTACLKLCDKIGGRDEDIDDRDCFGIDYDFATHKCYIFVDEEDVCDADDLVDNSSVVNIRYCT